MISGTRKASIGSANARAFPPHEGIRAQIRDLRTDNIGNLAVEGRKVGDVIPLWYGEGDMVTPAFIIDAAKAAMDAGETFYVPDMRGTGPLTATLAEYLTRLHGRPIDRDRTTVTPGGIQAVLLAMELLLDIGTNVVYVEPQWPNIHNAIHMVGGEPRPAALAFDGDWRLDLDALFARCDARTRAIFLSTPSNPLGWTASRQEQEALLDFSRRTGIWIVSDEVYGRLYFDGEAAPSMLDIAEDDDRVLVVNSFSKAWAMTGWRIGWLTHPSSVADHLSAMTQYSNSGTNTFVQAGAEAALREGEPLVARIRERARLGLDIAYEALSPLPRVILPPRPKGGMYAFFALQGEEDSREVCERLVRKARVGLAPGYLFGDASRSFLRMCVLRDAGDIREASSRLIAALA